MLGKFVNQLKHGVSSASESFGKKIFGVFSSGRIDDSLYDDLEVILLEADVGIKATSLLLKDLRQHVKSHAVHDRDGLQSVLRASMLKLLSQLEANVVSATSPPTVIMVVGVNGVGKTTSVGKLVKFLKQQGKSVLLASCDTFRAAAHEQLSIWALRQEVDIVIQSNGDPASIAHDAICSAKAKNIDVVIVDTAGRLATQIGLMEEIKKIKRVIAKLHANAPHEVLLTIDSTNGQNALHQIDAFDDALGVTGIILTKFDGTSKGGVVCAMAANGRLIPIKFVGVGEGIDDLCAFDADHYLNKLFQGVIHDRT